MRVRNRKIEIKNDRDIEAMRTVCRLAADTLTKVDGIIRPGLTTEEINTFVHEDTMAKNAKPAPLNYRGYPKSTCTSLNEVVCHGIPTSDRALVDGDIINVDITHIYEGYFGDTSATFYVGEPSDEARHVTEVCRRSLDIGLAQIKDGARLGDIGAAIQEFVEGHGCSVVRDFVGHGIGRKFHMEPMVTHYGKYGNGVKLKSGMIFTVEPMVNMGRHDVVILDDGWTAVTVDGSLSAQFEHTILVTDQGCEILTQRDQVLTQSERFPDYFG